MLFGKQSGVIILNAKGGCQLGKIRRSISSDGKKIRQKLKVKLRMKGYCSSFKLYNSNSYTCKRINATYFSIALSKGCKRDAK